MHRHPSFFRLLFGTFMYKVPYREAKHCLALIEAHNLPLTYLQLEAHHLAGGRMTSWVEGLIYAQERGIKMHPDNGAARDLVAACTTNISLREHIRAFEARGVTKLDSAPLDVAQLAPPAPSRDPARAGEG